MFYGPECGPSWGLFQVSLRRMWCWFWMKESVNVRYTQLIDRGGVELAVYLVIFCLMDLSIPDRGVFKTPATIVDSTVSPCSSVNFWLTCFYALLLDTFMLGIFMSSWRKAPPPRLYHCVMPPFFPNNFFFLIIISNLFKY